MSFQITESEVMGIILRNSKNKKAFSVYDMTKEFTKAQTLSKEWKEINNKVYQRVRNLKIKGLVTGKKVPATRGSWSKELIIPTKGGLKYLDSLDKDYLDDKKNQEKDKE